MPKYHKLMLNENIEISYHLSGYGIYREEALIRLLGEGIERYGLLTASLMFKDKIVYASYNELMEKEEMIPWKYIKLYSDEDYEKLKKNTMLRNITKDNIIGWLKCPSLFDAGKEYYVPAQCLFIGYQINEQAGEKLFTPGFSKGSSTHTNIKKALKGAIMEAVEADALMIKWYADNKAEKVIIDDLELLNIVNELLAGSDYELSVYNYSLQDMPANTFGVALVNKKDKTPFVTMGCSTSLDPVKGVYRGIMEALAILYLANNGSLVMPKDYLETTNEKEFINLDSNVAYWSNSKDIDIKRNILTGIFDGEIALSGMENYEKATDEEELTYLINSLRKESKYGVYLDITPVEVAGKGMKVMRVFFPELVQMSFPGFPYADHPRVKKYGGIKCELPHPLP